MGGNTGDELDFLNDDDIDVVAPGKKKVAQGDDDEFGADVDFSEDDDFLGDDFKFHGSGDDDYGY